MRHSLRRAGGFRVFVAFSDFNDFSDIRFLMYIKLTFNCDVIANYTKSDFIRTKKNVIHLRCMNSQVLCHYMQLQRCIFVDNSSYQYDTPPGYTYEQTN